MPLDAQMKARLRALTGADESATDDDLIARAADELDAQKADLTTAAGEVARLSAQVKDKDAKVLELSANAPKLDDLSPANRAMFDMNVATLRENAIKAGTVSAAKAAKWDALLMPGNKPGALALSASGTNGHPLAMNFWRELAEPDEAAIKVNNAALRLSTATPPNHGSHGDTQAAQTAEQLQAAVDANLAMTATGRRALAARKA